MIDFKPGERNNNEREIMSDMHRIGTNAEISAFEEAIRQNNELLERLKESRKQVENEALRIIDAMGLAFDQKNKSIDEMRAWRKTIQLESQDAINQINNLMNKITPERISHLKEFVSVLERLNNINPGIIVGKLFD